MRPMCWTPLLLMVGAHALATEPYRATYDEASRIRKVEYSDNLVIGVVGYPDHPLMVEFDASEPILDAAGGLIANWEIAKRGARLFARPMEGARQTTIVVGTKSRSYVLDLRPGTGKAPASFVSKIVVTYPKAEPSEASKNADAALALRNASTPLQESKRAARNARYSLEVVSETVDIRPREVFDDGRFTYFRYPENLPVPAIYKSMPGTSEEWLVNSHRDGDYVVVHGISVLWNLRASGSVLGIFNDAYDPVGLAPPGDTTVQGLKRVLR